MSEETNNLSIGTGLPIEKVESKAEQILLPKNNAMEAEVAKEASAQSSSLLVVEQKDTDAASSQYMMARVRAEFVRETPVWTQSNPDEEQKKHHTGFRKRTKMSRENQTGREIQLCIKVRKGLPCSFGESCRFSHDVERYLKERQPDLGDKCPILEAKGYCPMGFSCRFVGTHPTPESFGAEKQVELEAASEKYKAMLKSIHDGKYEFQGHHVKEQRKKNIDLKGKVYVAPLTTVGNLPFRRILVELGADVTCGEMALAHQIVRGVSSEFALLKRHSSEKLFGVQIAGSKPEEIAKAAEIISRECDADFIDLNMGCPIDDVTCHGGGSALMRRPPKIYKLVESILQAAPDVALGLKMRTGWECDKKVAHKIIEGLQPYSSQLAYVMVHGRSRLQRYTKTANWDYIANDCAHAAKDAGVQFVGNGDVLTWEDYRRATTPKSEGGVMDPDAPIATALLGRGALIKPWLCTEIKEQRVWDISASERLDLVRKFANYGLDHWGSDQRGVESTRRYLLEWFSFAFRYVPVGICEEGYNQHVNHRPPTAFVGRSDLETLLASPSSKDWEKIAEMFLGPSPEGYQFVPKHKANSW